MIEQKRGAKTRMLIAPLTMEDARELYRIVGNLEGHAGSLLGTLSLEDRVALADDLTLINREMHDIATGRQRDTLKIFELDAEFHHKIIEARPGPRLLNLSQIVKPQIERYWRPYASWIVGELALSVAEHAAIIAAIRKGQPRSIQRAIENNWMRGFERIAKVITLVGERGGWR